MILLDLIYQARKQSTYIFIAQQSIIHIKLQNSCVFLQHLCQVYCFIVLLFSLIAHQLPKHRFLFKRKKKLDFFFFQLLVTISICCYKRAMIIVDNCNSVDLLNMQTYCQVTSKKKRQNILVVLILFCRKPIISHYGNNSSVNFKASCYANRILLLYM